MKPVKLPVSVLIVACLYFAVGVLGFAAHFRELLTAQKDSGWVEITECLAIIAAIYLLRRHNWARWLTVAWIAFHVGLSAFHSMREAAVHGVICIATVGLLFNPAANEYFRRVESRST